MISMKFDTGDLDEFSQKAYESIEVKMSGNQEIAELVRLFKTFLYGLTYSPEMINEYLGEDE